ncbi:MAG: hypothetical protein AVDCRST_MAG91-3843 [uncultured Sphingomonadaceae bacterium]|uniref:Uncharacterized protein n=1 Tax=uncultured Sphingomonadaceae bacterium TaxID=169976 RepID=A0A6J4U567_9SPHN|nr:MAG: hypothetical protein AVDCRST_MAG91-3843 [uncultured Sphingomonadaceae bacterium]
MSIDLSGGYDAIERHRLEEAAQRLPALALAGRVTDRLAEVLTGAHIPDPEPPDAMYYRRSAILVMAVLGLRTARACMLVVAHGYWVESHGLKRRLSEAHARLQAIVDDETGQYARQWLEGPPPGEAKAVHKYGDRDTWGLYSWGAHADARSVHSWLSEEHPRARHALRPLPEHHDSLSNALLVELASELRDIARALAVARSRTADEVRLNVAHIETLDPDIDEMIKRFFDPSSGNEHPPEV